MIQLLAALGDDIKPSGSNWVARCKVHNDKDFAMSIKQADDGSILAHCHACGANGLDLYKALNLDLDELFGGSKADSRLMPVDVRETLSTDKIVVRLYNNDVQAGKRISWQDKKRYNLATKRIQGIQEKYIC